MIWSITSKEEMENYGISSVFKYYREALGKDNVKLAVVDENDKLDFLQKEDVALLRTASESLIKTIRAKGVKTTAEDFSKYELVKDKEKVFRFLCSCGIRAPKQYQNYLSSLQEGKTYFVKPRYGSDSFGISEKSICRTTKEVMEQMKYLKEEFGMESIVEEYITGTDCTVTCINNCTTNELLLCSISIDCNETNGIQTRDCKVGFKECCSAINDVELNRLASEIFHYLELKSHARIDFRKGIDGIYYPIDINLLPGLGPLDHLSKSLLLCKNMSYIDALKAVIASAS